jgi:hypothetical protein
VSGAAKRADDYAVQRQRQQKIFCGPLYSYANLLGIALAANPLTHQLPANRNFSVFSTPRGQIGQGWVTEMDEDVTNFEGTAMFPAGVSFVGNAIGVDLGQIPEEHIGRHIVRYGIVEQRKYSNEWRMGALRLWPEGSFGYSSPSVAATTPNREISFAQNGRIMAPELPPGCELVFTALDQIIFNLRVVQPVFLTTNGLVFNGIAFGAPGSNALDPVWGSPLGVVIQGTKFEQSAN